MGRDAGATIAPPRDPYNPFDERALRAARTGVFLYAVASGLGVGVFLEAPYTGAAVGAALGWIGGRWLMPALMREWRD